ncbi:hypothetical protein WA026_015974 [Henosepilachna vigintioctopunctata]|uniref:Mothers against decapentaplegic homolog n=1 Tax=Henosepilachna vigintioctopunctata TaxID=420089 RepID=A0AAW1U388_9CUCU
MDTNTGESSRNPLKSSFNTLISPALKKLFGWVKSDDEAKWAKQATGILYKKLKKKKGAIEELDRVLSCPGTPSKCITIPNTNGRRISVYNRKGLPHVIYCRIWRWPDLQSYHELKSIESCKYPFSFRNNDVCINPYHYDRVTRNVLSPVSSSKVDNTSAHSQHLVPQPVEPNISCNASKAQDGVNGRTSPTAIPSHESSSGSIKSKHPQYKYENLGKKALPTPENLSNTSINSDQVHQIVTKVETLSQPYTPDPEQPTYASISYYELYNRIGEIFHVHSNSVIVDGFTEPNTESNRFCLGMLNNVSRNSTVEKTRKHIGKGVQLYFVNEEVYVECLSDRALFLQSGIYNYQKNYHPSTVCKITRGCPIRVFSSVDFAEVLSECLNHGFEAVYNLTNMCTIRISFVKGWGANYLRPDITNTPCWIEILLHKPLKWLDEVLMKMGGPNTTTNSLS